MQAITNIEKTIRKKQAESQTELEILKIKYGNLKVNYRSLDMQGGLMALKNRRRVSPSNSYAKMAFNRQSTGSEDVNIGLHDLEQQHFMKPTQAQAKMSPLAMHYKTKAVASQR